MGKIRVYELAKELGLDNHECVTRLVAAGFIVKTHSSTVDEDDARRALTRPPEKKVEEKKPQKVVIRRRAKEDEVPAEGGEATPAPAAIAALPASVAVPESPVVAAPALPEPAPVAAPPASPAAAPVEAKPEPAVAQPEPVVAKLEAPPAMPPTPLPVPLEARPMPPPPPAPPVSVAARPPAPPPVPPRSMGGNVRTIERTPMQGRPGEPRGPRPAVGAAPMAAGQAVPPAAAAAAGAKPPDESVSRVVRMIDPQAIRDRLRAEGRDLGPRRPGPRAFTPNREFAVQNKDGRGPQVTEVTRPGDRPAAPGAAAARPGNKKPGKGGKGGPMDSEAGRREARGMRGDAREMWQTVGRKKKSTKRGQETQVTTPAAHKRVVEIQGTISVGELSRQMAVKVGDVIRKLMGMGMMVTMNQTIDYDAAALIAQEFEFEVKNVAFQETELIAAEAQRDEDMSPRPPVVTIMGHVDHGKTSLLDAIRSANVAAGEAGGITQHIGAYSVMSRRGQITFLDTPGHEAFTAMRARGAQVTDIVVLVVAGDDGPMPQTFEAINHAKAAGVPVVVAVNKMDKPDANIERVQQQLSDQGLIPEAWGGTTMYYPVSAKKKEGINELLEGLLLQAEVLELKANHNKRAKGTIVEAQLDRGRGPVATVLVQEGTLRLGDPVVAGDYYGRVRAMYDDRGNPLEVATPSTPVAVLGLDGVPNAGDSFDAVQDADTAKTVADHRSMKTREQALVARSRVTLENWKQIVSKSAKDAAKELKLIVKADVQGSVEAVAAALQRLSNNQVKVTIVHSGVGAMTKDDVNLAAASEAIIIGFGVRPDPKATAHAEQNNVEIRTYSIIYEAVSEVRAAMEGLLAPTYREKYIGRAEVRQTFHVAKVGTVAGCSVTDGKLSRVARVRVIRDSRQVFEGKLASLRRFKDDVKEVAQGYECGLGIENFNDLKVGDIIEAFEVETIRTKLEGVPDANPNPRTTQPEARA